MNYYYNGVDNSAYLAHYGVLGQKWGQHLMAKTYTKEGYAKRMSDSKYSKAVDDYSGIALRDSNQGDWHKLSGKQLRNNAVVHLRDMQSEFQKRISSLDNEIISYGSNPLAIVKRNSAVKKANKAMMGWTLARDTEEYLMSFTPESGEYTDIIDRRAYYD